MSRDTKFAITVAIVFVLVVVAASWALAQPLPAGCGEREPFVEKLDRDFDEDQRFAGMTVTGTVIELWLDEEDGSWTAIETYTNGITCVRSDGHGGALASMPQPPGELN